MRCTIYVLVQLYSDCIFDAFLFLNVWLLSFPWEMNVTKYPCHLKWVKTFKLINRLSLFTSILNNTLLFVIKALSHWTHGYVQNLNHSCALKKLTAHKWNSALGLVFPNTYKIWQYTLDTILQVLLRIMTILIFTWILKKSVVFTYTVYILNFFFITLNMSIIKG